MTRRSEYSLRGRISTAKKAVEKMISNEEYSASFAGLGINPPTVTGEELNQWIKERIRLYVQTWVLPPLEEALAKVTK